MTMNISSNPNYHRVALIVFFGFIAAALTPSSTFGGQAASRAVTFTRDIAPILQRSCENCHRTSGVDVAQHYGQGHREKHLHPEDAVEGQLGGSGPGNHRACLYGWKGGHR